ncbi:hypothetical protein ACGFYU_31390 [Streptomyces sp. NPDC048337]|uniref:hypothetical protein n=1 Tax=Streptomyces sp. NPDC048337 TaxID=3365535 RepID=UPI00371CB4BE
MTLVHFNMRTFANFALVGAALAGVLVVSAGSDRSADRTASLATAPATAAADPGDRHPDDQGWG